jgi:DNA invertase Pin-like site-specific DNA recombinase
MLQAYVYIRFSTLKQEKGASKERQLDDCRAYCTRKGWPVIEEIEDLGRSAWKGDHLKSGNLGKFAARVHAGEIPPGSVLVVEKLDRLSRQDVRFTQRWLEDLCAAGISIATVSGDRVYDDESLRTNLMQTLEVLLVGKLAHDESQNKSDRIGDSWRRKQEKAKAGVVMTTKCPGWLKVKEDRSGFDLIPDRVAVAREVYQRAADGHGARSIAQQLNARGVPSWGDARKDGRVIGWTDGFLVDLLRSPAVEGEYHPNFRPKKGNLSDAPVLGYYPRIIDADLVARARAAVASRKGTGGRYRHTMTNLFQGLCVCWSCGGRMTMRRTPVTKADGTKRYDSNLQCANAYSALRCEQRAFFNYTRFEQTALDAILHLTLSDRFFQRAASSVQLAIKVAEIEKALTLKRDEAKRLVRLLAAMDDMPEVEEELRAAQRFIRENEQALKVAQEELTRAKGAVSPAEHLQRVMDVREAIEHEDEDTRTDARMKVNEAMRAVVQQVVCNANDEAFGGSRTFTVNLPLGAVVIDTNGKHLNGQTQLGELLELSPHDMADIKRRSADWAEELINAFELLEAREGPTEQPTEWPDEKPAASFAFGVDGMPKGAKVPRRAKR